MAIEKTSPMPSQSKTSNAVLGIGFMAAGMLLFACADTLAKLLTADFHPLQIAWSRMVGLFGGVLVLLAFRGGGFLKSNQPKLQVARGFCAVISASIFIVALKYVPLADAVAVSFVAPFMVTILSVIFLGETVGKRRWIAIAIGFIGTLIILRPGSGSFHPGLLLVVVAALAFAMRQILSRKLSGADGTSTTLAYTGLVSMALLTIPLPFIWQAPTTSLQITFIVSIAILSLFGELMVIKALDIAQAVVLAPVHYSLLIWGTISGYFVFNQLPDIWTWVGTAIIVATGIYTFRREAMLAKQSAIPK